MFDSISDRKQPKQFSKHYLLLNANYDPPFIRRFLISIQKVNESKTYEHFTFKAKMQFIMEWIGLKVRKSRLVSFRA